MFNILSVIIFGDNCNDYKNVSTGENVPKDKGQKVLHKNCLTQILPHLENLIDF